MTSALITWPVMKNKFEGVFFDLDGTLLDTAPDLYQAMLKTLDQLNKKPVSFEKFRPQIHTGTKSMIKFSLNIDDNDPDYLSVREIFLKNYLNGIHVETDYFPGMDTILDHLDEERIPWGIVTNKPGFLTEPLIASIGLDKRSQCVISGDTLAKRKPNPDPLLHACKLTAISPNHSAYIGDTHGDVIAANAAGMTSIAVSYGYHDPNHHPETWDARHIIETPLKLLNLLKN